MLTNSVEMLKKYNLFKFKADLKAGLSVAAISLPQDMAYALIAGLNPIYGLFTFIISTFVTTFTGTSNYMVVGSTNIIALAIASSLSSINVIDQSNYLECVFLLTFMVGTIQMILGILKLGNLVNYVSQAVIIGLTAGVALIIGTGQLARFLGLQVNGGNNVLETVYIVVRHLSQVNYYALFIGLLTILIIIISKKIIPQYPPYLVAVIFTVILVIVTGLQDKVTLVGNFGSFIPEFHFIKFNFPLVKKLLSSALSISILGFIQVLSIVKGLEKRSRQETSLNNEFIGQGITNIVCSFFRGFVITGSFTKSFANFEAGAKTRISELIAGMTVLLCVVLFGSLVSLIPIPTLAGIVIFVAINMFDKKEIKQSCTTTSFDAIVFVSTFLTTILTPRLDYAVYFGVVVSFILVLKNTSDINYSHIEYDKKGDKDFHQRRQEDINEDEKVVVINIVGTLHFNASENLKKKLNNSFNKNKVFVIRMRDVSEIDITSIQELEKFIDRVHEEHNQVIFCGVRDDIYKRLDNYGLITKIQEENIFRSSDDIFSSTKNAIKKAEKTSQAN